MREEGATDTEPLVETEAEETEAAETEAAETEAAETPLVRQAGCAARRVVTQTEDEPELTMSSWAPSVWRALHLIALGAPREATEAAASAGAYVRFFEAVGPVLPCAECAEGYGALLDDDGGRLRRELADAARSGALFEWSVRLHNAVNRKTGRDDTDWTPERARAALLRPKNDDAAGLLGLHHPHGGGMTLLGAVVALALGFLVAWAAWAAARGLVRGLARGLARGFLSLPPPSA